MTLSGPFAPLNETLVWTVGPVGVRFDPKFRTDVGVEEFMDNFKK